jgi:hypothetical protein
MGPPPLAIRVFPSRFLTEIRIQKKSLERLRPTAEVKLADADYPLLEFDRFTQSPNTALP